MLIDKDLQFSTLLTFIKEHENDKESVSRQKVAHYMNKQGLSSRVTTLNMINALLQEGILLDEKTKNYESKLKVHPLFDFHGLLVEALRLQYYGMDKILDGLRPLLKNKKIKMEFKLDDDKNVQITFGPFKE